MQYNEFIIEENKKTLRLLLYNKKKINKRKNNGRNFGKYKRKLFLSNRLDENNIILKI